MRKQIPLISMGVIFCLGFTSQVQAYERIFYEDCEDTAFNEYFLERHYGSNESSYYNILKSALTRSNHAHSGLYSMTYNPFSDANPHARLGTPFTYGNTSGFNFRNHNGRYWYFRWYQQWETGIDWGGYMVKMLYVNRQPVHDFTYIVVKTTSSSFLSTLKDFDTYNIVDNKYGSMPSTDDGQWHKIEVLLDVGTTGADNGSITFTVDNQLSYNKTGLTYNGTITNNPLAHIAIPANRSGKGGSGTANTWLDDIEIYTLKSSTDIPPELNSSNPTLLTLTQITPIPTPTSNPTPSYTFSSNKAGKITYGGDCSSATTLALSGSNTITLNSLGDGTYSNCTITVTDTTGLTSNSLSITSFTINRSIASNTKADVDQSGSIDTIDALLTLRNSLGLDMTMTNWQPTGDVNCDGVSNSVDAMLILRDVQGLSMSDTQWCAN